MLCSYPLRKARGYEVESLYYLEFAKDTRSREADYKILYILITPNLIPIK